MKEDHDNKSMDAVARSATQSPPSVTPQAVPQLAAKPSASHDKKQRKDLSGIPVEIIQAKECNPANPYSYLMPQERADRLAKLWHEMFQRIDATGANPLDKQSL